MVLEDVLGVPEGAWLLNLLLCTMNHDDEFFDAVTGELRWTHGSWNAWFMVRPPLFFL